ncbi:hypothetical protein VTN31DRAFT_721 [Thermomyces dupontii]|uniref:uncharacterized protein n=1 Tax=Talaromyces thermophilus TaxID=28565 RepID=UPI0037447E46
MDTEARSLDERHLIELMIAMIIACQRRVDNLETKLDHLKDSQVAIDRRLNLLKCVLFRADLNNNNGRRNVMRLRDCKTISKPRPEKQAAKNSKQVRFVLDSHHLEEDEELFGYKNTSVLRDSMMLRNTPPDSWEYVILEDQFRDLYGVEFDRIEPYIDKAPRDVIRALDARAAAAIAGFNATDILSEDVLALNTWLNSLPIEG